MLTKTRLCTFAAIALCLFCAPAYAEKGKQSFFDQSGEPFTPKYFKKSPHALMMSLQRDPDLESSQFVVHLSLAEEMTSCAKYSNLPYSTNIGDGTMDITVGDYAVDMRDMPQYAHYQCNTNIQQPSADIVLSKELLQQRNISKIRFRTSDASEFYKVTLTDDYIQLLPESTKAPQSLKYRPAKVTGISNPLRYWFYPEGTVVLSADGLGKDLVLAHAVESLAKTHGLVPLETVMPDHKPVRRHSDDLYFVDKDKKVQDKSGQILDYVQADVMKYGLEGDEPGKKNIGVSIRKPGQFD